MKKILFLLLAPVALFTQSAGAQNATTTPVGAMTYNFPATTQLTSTYISVPLTNTPTYSGPVASFGTNTITFSGTPFTNGALAQSGAPYFLRFQSGAQAGRTVLITANTANSVTVDVTDNSSQTTNLNASGFSVAASDQVQIVPGDTLAGFFGDNSLSNPLLIVGTGSAFTADTINIYNKSLSKMDGYFFSTTLGYWRDSSSTLNRNNVVLYPDSGVVLNRRAGRAALSITVIGEVPTVPNLSKTAGASQVVYTSSRVPVNVTLATLNLANWTKSNSAFTADTISLYNPTTSKMDGYYQKLDGTWRKAGDAATDQSNVSIPAGVLFAVLKRSSVSGATSYLSVPMPYSL